MRKTCRTLVDSLSVDWPSTCTPCTWEASGQPPRTARPAETHPRSSSRSRRTWQRQGYPFPTLDSRRRRRPRFPLILRCPRFRRFHRRSCCRPRCFGCYRCRRCSRCCSHRLCAPFLALARRCYLRRWPLRCWPLSFSAVCRVSSAPCLHLCIQTTFTLL